LQYSYVTLVVAVT